MIVIIDGYNLLKQLFPDAPKNMVKQRDAFIRQLGWYQAQKQDSIDQIIVVFDGGPEKHATREIKSGIVVIFSGIKSSADNWIINFAEKNRDKEMLLITLDNGLRKECLRYGADAVSVFDFYKIMQETILSFAEQTSNYQLSDTEIQKYKNDDMYTSFNEELESKNFLQKQGLDLLMEQASGSIPTEKLFEEKKEPVRRSKHMTLSKKEKRLLSKIKKIE